jgi:dTDP-glucose pyrophosphorylase
VTPTAPLAPHSTVRDAIKAIEMSRMSLAVVVNRDGQLIGTVSDGDVRRAILSGHDLDAPVETALNRHPVTADVNTTEAELAGLLADRQIEAIPLLDSEGRYIRLVHVRDIGQAPAETATAADFSAAVIMAGGEGQRLRPMTQDMPKPMIEVGGMPIIERLVRTLVHAGVHRIFIAINYLGDRIESHFGDGSAFGARIDYLREPEKLGTAGALSLLPYRPDGPLLVINGDILTASDYGKLLAHHRAREATITVGAIQYRVDIPFGVLAVDDARVTGIAEKPSQRVLCNAGIYVMSPAAIDRLDAGAPVNMTDLIERTIARGETVVAFPIHEYWNDIGTPVDLERARRSVDHGENGL